MKHIIRTTWHIVAVLLVAVLLNGIGSFNAEPQVSAAPELAGDCVNLFSPSTARATLSAADAAVAKAGTLRFVSVNTSAVNRETVATGKLNGLCLSLPPNGTERALFDQATLHADGYEWVGHLEGIKASQVTIVGNQGALAAYIATPTGAYSLRRTSAGVYAIYAINEQAFPNDGHLVIPSSGYEPSSPSGVMVDDGSIIDVMVLYTPDARVGAGGMAAIETLIDMAIAQTNTAFQNSLVNTRYRLVYKGEIAYTEGGNSDADLTALQNTSDGLMDSAHTLRDTYKADLVHLITERSQYCGLGYQLTDTSGGGSPTFAFALTVRTCAVDNMTFAHEGGHNMGAAHDRANQPSGGVYTYSFAYRDPGFFRTIMAYSTGCANPCGKAPHFSNPAINYNSRPTGASDANNAQTFNNTAATVAQYRTSLNVPTCFTLTTPAANGSVTRNQNPDCNSNTQYISGTLVSLTAVPNANFAFTNWSGDVTDTANPTTVLMSADKSVTANFQQCYTLATTVTGGSGSVTTEPTPNCDNGKRYSNGTVVTLTATLNTGTTFQNWSGDVTDTANPIMVTMDANKNVTANLSGCVSLTTVVDPLAGGGINVSPAPDCADGTQRYNASTNLTLTAAANSNYTFLLWKGAVISTTNPLNFTLSRDDSVTVNFLDVTNNDNITNARQIALQALCIPSCVVYLPLVLRESGTPRETHAPQTTISTPSPTRPARIGNVTTTLVYDDIIDTSNATHGAEDPISCSGGSGTASVWYVFTAPVTGTLHVDTNGSDYDTVVTVWEGAPGNLISAGCDDDSGEGDDSSEDVFVQGGVTYYIEIADAEPPDEGITPPTSRTQNYGGLLQLQIRFTPYPY